MTSNQSPNPLNYHAALKVRLVSKKQLIGFAVAALFAIALFAVLQIPAYDKLCVMDEVTGSTQRTTTWRFGITSGPVLEVSPLERRLKKMGVQWKSNWGLVYDTSYSLSGIAIVRACGTAPPIYHLKQVQEVIVNAQTDSQILEFVRVMQIGTSDEKAAAVAALEEQTTEAIEASRGR